MRNFRFSPFGTSALNVHFECKNCTVPIDTEVLVVPPDYSAENVEDSTDSNHQTVICEHCGDEYDIVIYSTIAGGSGTISNLSSTHQIELEEVPETYYEEEFAAISKNKLFYENFCEEIHSLKELNRIRHQKTAIEAALRRQLYSGAIGCLETYLSDAFINTVFRSPYFLRKFVETYHDFKQKTIAYSDMFKQLDDIEDSCKKVLLDIIYHNIPKVRGMYQSTLGINFGDISVITKAVTTRHDLVHRTGKTKEGKEVYIDETAVSQLIEEVERFVRNIDQQIQMVVADEADYLANAHG